MEDGAPCREFSCTRRSALLAAPLGVAAALSRFAGTSPPAPRGALPADGQIRWSELEFYNFLHFTVNTFTNKEWGYGNEDPAIFNPTDFDADAIVEVLKAAGSKGVILTCKHHDGFCLWPTNTTEHSVRHSPYKGGKGDIVKEVAEAAARHGLKFGVYVSPWDRNQATYGTPRYIRIFRQQLRELLTGYGPIFEIWHDGANGGSGYYGGANETRTIDKLRYYDWPATWSLERELQSGAAIFSDVGPDIRWVGNEKGIAGETCWATCTPRSPNGGPGAPGDIVETESTTGTFDGKYWMPAECDVSIRPGWFWHPSESQKVKTPRQLLDLYYVSVGRGASFLLNVPPDRRGLIDEADAESLRGFGKALRATFETNLTRGAKATAANVRNNDPAYGPQNLLDGERLTYWATDDSVTRSIVTLDLARPSTFDLVRLRENIGLGQRIREFAVETWKDNEWLLFGQATSIGSCRILRSPVPVTTTRVRLQIAESAACPALSELALFRETLP